MEQIKFFNSILQSFQLKANCVDYQQIDNYFFYDVKLQSNGKVKDINRYSDEISLALKSPCKPSIKVLHQSGLVRLEFVGARQKSLKLFDFFTNKHLPQGEINCLLGQSVDGHRVWMDLAQNPHLIIAGTPGSGKSSLLHNIVANLFNYNDVDLILIDPKKIEFAQYDLSLPTIRVFYSYLEALEILQAQYNLMEFRYDLIRAGQSQSSLKPVVIIIDEFADLIMQDKDDQFYQVLCKLAQKCRAARIHIILATQRPSVNIINGTIKANFPARIACRVVSHIDSKVILDASGAEHLLGQGDALIRDNTRYLERFQIAFTTPQEVKQYYFN